MLTTMSLIVHYKVNTLTKLIIGAYSSTHMFTGLHVKIIQTLKGPL